MPLKVHIINSSIDIFRVHRVDCRDINRDLRTSNSDWILEVQDGKTVVAAVVDDLNESFGWKVGDEDPQPWHEYDIRVLPCCKGV